MPRHLRAPPTVALAVAATLCGTAHPAAQQVALSAENVVSGLELASAMAFAPDGRLFVLERIAGRVTVFDGAGLTTWATIPVAGTAGDSKGLLGIAVDPGFLRNGHVYVGVSDWRGGGENVVLRLQDVGGVGTNPVPIGPRTPVARIHNVGPMAFGVDGKLFAAYGDGRTGGPARKLGTALGKIVRMNVPDGSVPGDNPFPGDHTWSMGHRNVFGLAVHPATGQLYATENGNMSEDEVNRIVRGRDYGWPTHEGTETTPDPGTEDPLFTWAPPIAPTGTCFASNEIYPAALRDAWIMADYNRGQLTTLQLDTTGTAVVATSVVHDYGRFAYGVVQAPDGHLWVLRSGSTGPGRGAVAIDRLVDPAGPRPSLALTAVSNLALGGSVTVGMVGSPGDLALAWFGTSRLSSPVVSPLGNLSVPFDLVLPAVPIGSDARAYIPLSVPRYPGARGTSLHAQAATLSAGTLRLTNADSLLLH